MENAIFDMQHGKHPYQAARIIAQSKQIEELELALQKSREKEFKTEGLKKDTNLAWPQNLTVYDERLKLETVKDVVKLLHNGLAPALFRQRLHQEIEAALKNNRCKRYLLNHIAFFPDEPAGKALIDFRNQCQNCNQYFTVKNIAKHRHRCAKTGAFKTWLGCKENMPTA